MEGNERPPEPELPGNAANSGRTTSTSTVGWVTVAVIVTIAVGALIYQYTVWDRAGHALDEPPVAYTPPPRDALTQAADAYKSTNPDKVMQAADSAFTAGDAQGAVGMLESLIDGKVAYDSVYDAKHLVKAYLALHSQPTLTQAEQKAMQDTLNRLSMVCPNAIAGYDQEGNATGLVSNSETTIPADPAEGQRYSADLIARNAIKLYMGSAAKASLGQAESLYRDHQYSAAIDALNIAIDYGSREAKGLLPQYQARSEADQRLEARQQQDYYSGAGPVEIAVGGVELRHATGTHAAESGMTFVYVEVDAKNIGSDMTSVNPNDFTLATPEGLTVSHCSDTYSLRHYFDAVDLRPSQSTAGWLIFYMERAGEYTLSYQGVGGSAQKTVVPAD